MPPTPASSTAHSFDPRCSCAPTPLRDIADTRLTPSVRQRVGCRAGSTSALGRLRFSRVDVGLHLFPPLLARLAGVDLEFESIDHVGCYVGDVDIELLVPPPQLIDRTVFLDEEGI